MRFFTKVVIVSVVVAAAVFAITYTVVYTVESPRLRELGRQQREALSRGEIMFVCGPLPHHYAIAYGLLTLVTAPVVLLSARGVWRLCTRHDHNV